MLCFVPCLPGRNPFSSVLFLVSLPGRLLGFLLRRLFLWLTGQ